METGTLEPARLVGGFDLYLTLESGQSYLWGRSDGGIYGGTRPTGAWYETVADGEVIRLRQRDGVGSGTDEPAGTSVHAGGVLEWESTTDDAEAILRRRLRLDDDLEAIVADAPEDPLLREAYDVHRGMRLVTDPPFPTTISFICSAQMRVRRIHEMVESLSRAYGTVYELDGRRFHSFPTPEQLAAATEADLRELGLGYRAPYVQATAAMVAAGEATPDAAGDLSYEEAREYLTRFVGVGEKVADCICLFSLGFDEAVPLDTWIRGAIADHYPDCDRGSYGETSRAIRERLGGRYAGYAQTYLFHHLRTDAVEPGVAAGTDR